jgi:two-component system, NtrC family, sensor histidine kinase PilS
MLARRVVANEALAHRRGVELDNQLRISQQVILDMQDGVLVVDSDGRVRQHNPQAEVLLDVHPQEDEDLRTFSPDLAVRFARLGQGGEEAEDFIRVAGSGRLLRARFLPPGEGGYALIYLEDMSRIQAQAQQIKLAALGRLTANIAHEIRNPLAAISHAAELLGEERREGTADRLTRIIGDNARRLNRLVGEVLELGRRDRAQLEDIPLAGFLRQVLDEYSLHDPTVPVRVMLRATQEAVIRFDRGHLHRVVENLLANALRYASQYPSAIRIEAGAISSIQVELHIIDDGPGIEAGNRAHVFEPFFTTHGGGTGLGLYIARELCEANGAILELAETVGGAHFRIVAEGRECQTRNDADTAS